MRVTHRQRKLLQFARRKLGLDEAAYRDALVTLAGVTSSTDLEREGFEVMMGYFEYLGFQPLRSGPDFGKREGMASYA